MNILKIQVLLTDGSDHCSVHTDLPSPFSYDDSPLVLDFKTTINTGVDYVRRVFGVEPEVINIRVIK